MAKTAHAEAPAGSGASSRPMNEPGMIPGLQPEAIAESCSRVVQQMESINRAWLGSVQRAHESGWDLAGRLARCSDPMEANGLCTEWLNERRDAMLADSKSLFEQWLKLYEPELMPAPMRPYMAAAE